MKNPAPILLTLAAAAVVVIPQVDAFAQSAAPTPPPPPPNLTQPQASPSASPAASAAPGPGDTSLDSLLGPKPKASASPGATPSPPPDDRKGLDGVWELQLQLGGDKVEYDHFNLKQAGNALTGSFLDNQKKVHYPLSGSVDGESVRIVVSLPDGSTILMQGRLDGTTDMLGMYTDPKQNIPFTAAYRPKEKWVDNLNANPGLPTGGGGTPPQ